MERGPPQRGPRSQKYLGTEQQAGEGRIPMRSGRERGGAAVEIDISSDRRSNAAQGGIHASNSALPNIPRSQLDRHNHQQHSLNHLPAINEHELRDGGSYEPVIQQASRPLHNAASNAEILSYQRAGGLDAHQEKYQALQRAKSKDHLMN